MNTPRPVIYNKVLGRLKDNPAEDTMRMAQEVGAIMVTAGWAHVQDLLALMGTDLDVLIESGVHQQAEYAAMVAERRTLRNLQAVADAIVEAGRKAEQDLNTMAAQMEARGSMT